MAPPSQRPGVLAGRLGRRHLLGQLARLSSVGLAGPALGVLAGACERQQPPLPLEKALLEAAAGAGFAGADGQQKARAELRRIARRVRETSGPPAEALIATLFRELGYERVVEGLTARHMLLPPVLQDRRGSCVGLGCLTLVLAEQLSLPAWGVLVPGHFFVQLRSAGQSPVRNVELLRQGEAMPERWYRDKYGVPAAGNAAYLRPLTSTEVLAVVAFNLGNHYREANQLARAADHYRRATGDFPGFPEAHASLGLVLQLQGELAAARQAYETARRLHPTLPGLERNMTVLDQELTAASK